MNSTAQRRCGIAVAILMLFADAAVAGGIRFPTADCAFGHWPATGWEVAPTPPSQAGQRLLRASHSKSLGVAVEAWLATSIPATGEASEDPMALDLAKRGWQLDLAAPASVGTRSARRARAHRRSGRDLYLLDEYWIESGSRRYVLRITSRGARGLQHPEVQRWLGSFQIGG